MTTTTPSVPSPASIPDGNQALILNQVEAGAITVQIDEAEIRKVATLIDRTIAASDRAIAKIRRLSGPNAQGVPAHLITVLNMGAGYARHCQAVLRALHRARNTAKRAKGPR